MEEKKKFDTTQQNKRDQQKIKMEAIAKAKEVQKTLQASLAEHFVNNNNLINKMPEAVLVDAGRILYNAKQKKEQVLTRSKRNGQ